MMNERQHTETNDTKVKIRKTGIPQTWFLMVGATIGMMIAQIVNNAMPGQTLWLRMLVAAFTGAVFGFGLSKIWRTRLSVTSAGGQLPSDSQSAN